MLFNSYIFILAFLPAFLVGWYALNRIGKYRVAQGFLVLMSLIFYGYENYYYVLLIVGSILVNWLIVTLISGIGEGGRKALMAVGVAANLLVLGFFKYTNFFLDNFRAVTGNDVTFLKIALPLGISFYTFQQIGYVVDCGRGEAQRYSLLDYASFVVFFPQLIAGPIVSHEELIPQFRDYEKRKYNAESFTIGWKLFIAGLAKKVLLADWLGRCVDEAFGGVEKLGTVALLVVSLSYTLQIFLDFSGYSDMAMGLGKMIGIDLPLNFALPYKAADVQDFWKRWHITLNRFFTKYVYIPLGGSRCGRVRTIVNIMITFLLSGLWHGADWAFVLWGALHGVMVVLSRYIKKLPVLVGQIITFLFVNFAWVLFRAGDIRLAGKFFSRLAVWDGVSSFLDVSEAMYAPPFYLLKELLERTGHGQFAYLAVFWIVILIVSLRVAFGRRNTLVWATESRLTRRSAYALAFLLVLCILSFSGVTKFLYFNF